MDICMDYPEGLIKMPIYDASALVKGQALKWGQDAASVGTVALVDVADTAADIFAVLQETPASMISNVQTPISYQATVRLVGNPTIFKIYVDLTASTDLDVASSTSTIVTVAAVDDNMDGGWLYITSGTGAGQLRYIKAADTTTLTVNTAFTTTPDATSDFILIRPVGLQAASAGLRLNSTFDKILSTLNEDATSTITPIKNFVQGPMGTKELDITLNPDLECDGLSGRGVRFYSLCVITDGIYATGI